MKTETKALITNAEKKYKAFKDESPEQVQIALENIEAQMQESFEFVQNTLSELKIKMEEAIRENPIRFLAAAFSAGILVGMTVAKLRQLDSEE